jgi:formate dehydrogenase (NADP+) beta subunit
LGELVLGVWGSQRFDRRLGDSQPQKFTNLADLPVYAPGQPVQAVLAWDGFFVFDSHVDVIDMARAYMNVVQGESCGKCVPCRMGTRVAADVLTRIAEGRGQEDDIDLLRNVGALVRDGSMCELGHTSMNAVLGILDEYEPAFRQAIHQGVRRTQRIYHTRVTAPCVEACPERLDIPRYIDLIKSGRYTESLSVIHEKNPLASVCGRVCVRFCEFSCRRGKLDDPVSIKHLKRFVSDVEMDTAVKKYEPIAPISPTAQRVAVVGAGPAGVTAAYHLLRRGYAVEIFEALDEPGGMAAVGIPDYRLPREVLRSEVAIIEHMGAQLHYSQRMGVDFTLTGLKKSGFAAIFVAIGAQLSSAMRVPGEDQKPQGYLPGVEFLRSVNRHEDIIVGKHAVVVGGGNVAMDCARSALRLGVPQVDLVYRRTRDAMPADKVEVHDAEEEGIRYHFLCNPTRVVVDNGQVVGLECLRMELGEPDASGRRSPVPVPGSEFVLPCDMVIPAIGQRVDTGSLGESGIAVTKRNTLGVDADTLLTDTDGIFAGGDCVSGPATLIEAMAAGFRVSNSIDQYLRNGVVRLTEDERMSRIFRSISSVDEDFVDRLGSGQRIEIPLRDVQERVNDFGEVEMGLSPEDALMEADRCLRCYRIMLVAAGDETGKVA